MAMKAAYKAALAVIYYSLATRSYLALTDFFSVKIRKLFSDENRQIVLKFESVMSLFM